MHHGLRVAGSYGAVPRVRATSRWRSWKVVLAVCSAWRNGWMSGRRPRVMLWARRRVGFFIFVGASRVYTSLCSQGVFSPAVVFGLLSWRDGVFVLSLDRFVVVRLCGCVGCVLWCWVLLYGFRAASSANKSGISFLINGNGKDFAFLSKKEKEQRLYSYTRRL